MLKLNLNVQTIIVMLASFITPIVGHTQEWPDKKPITLVVEFTLGGGADHIARVLANVMGKISRSSVVVQNRPGAGSSIAAGYVVRSSTDGYTALIASPSAIQVNPIILPNLGYDPRTDLAPIAQLVATPLILVVNPKLGVTTLS